LSDFDEMSCRARPPSGSVTPARIRLPRTSTSSSGPPPRSPTKPSGRCMPEITPSAEYFASRLPDKTSILVPQMRSASAMNARPACARLAAFAAAKETAGAGFFKRFSTAGQAWIGHEIFVRIEGFLAGQRLYARRGAVRQELPALLVVLEIRHHDLVEHLLVHRRIEHR